MKVYIHPAKKMECTYCGADSGEDCKDKNGMNVPFHHKRWKSWESHQKLIERQKKFLGKNPKKLVLISVNEHYDEAEKEMHGINDGEDINWSPGEFRAVIIPDDLDIIKWNVWVGTADEVTRGAHHA